MNFTVKLVDLQVLMNTILFWRILSVDFSGMFRASFSSPSPRPDKAEREQGGQEGLGNYLRTVLQEADSGNKLAQE